MIIERLWPANAWRNYHYLIACSESGEALAVDPLDWELCARTARERGWTITQILNTHEHGDHIGGNEPLRAATGARVLAHAGAGGRIPGLDRGLAHGETVRVGKTVELECLDTPGHTRAHLCLLARGRAATAAPELLCGDTLFNAGAGNCHNGGDPQLLYHTFVDCLARLPNATRIHPGHDYLARNLAFTLDREPGNGDAAALLAYVRGHDGAQAPITTLGDERRINTFFRLQNPAVIAGLRSTFADLPDQPDSQTIFLKLRELRNCW
ncbi:MAG: hydroxyacylglutathione hydrolase [Gammaproteobacteria bacterium]|nr:hydroxyacylglutathione hydrolase [Gammaproteobacteria bacterium]